MLWGREKHDTTKVKGRSSPRGDQKKKDRTLEFHSVTEEKKVKQEGGARKEE